MRHQLIITKIFKVLDAIDSVLRSNIPIRAKLNCVVMRGLNEDEIINFVDWTQVSSFNNTLFYFNDFCSNAEFLCLLT